MFYKNRVKLYNNMDFPPVAAREYSPDGSVWFLCVVQAEIFLTQKALKMAQAHEQAARSACVGQPVFTGSHCVSGRAILFKLQQ